MTAGAGTQGIHLPNELRGLLGGSSSGRKGVHPQGGGGEASEVREASALHPEGSSHRPGPREGKAIIPECTKTKGAGSSSSLGNVGRARGQAAVSCPDPGPLILGQLSSSRALTEVVLQGALGAQPRVDRFPGSLGGGRSVNTSFQLATQRCQREQELLRRTWRGWGSLRSHQQASSPRPLWPTTQAFQRGKELWGVRDYGADNPAGAPLPTSGTGEAGTRPQAE